MLRLRRIYGTVAIGLTIGAVVCIAIVFGLMCYDVYYG
jgi:uncharacterized protein (DUF2062 family)